VETLDATSPLLPLPAPPTSSSPHRAFLHRRLHLRVTLTVGERALIPSLCGAWPSSQGRARPRASCRVDAVALCDAGLRARLGYLFVQVPQPSSPRAHPTCRPPFLLCLPPFYRSSCRRRGLGRRHGRGLDARTHALSLSTARLCTHARARVLQGRRRPDPFIPLSLDRS
jgi:hypothetical protein